MSKSEARLRELRTSTNVQQQTDTTHSEDPDSEKYDYDIGQTEESRNKVQNVIDAAWESLD